MKYPIKAEVLITRRCDIRCPHCGIVRNGIQERTPEYWQRALSRLSTELGVAFFPIYGGEPLVYEKLPELISKLSESNLPFSIISNSILLTREMAKDFIDRGLKSYTVSVDTLDSARFKSPVLRRRNDAALRALDIFQDLGLPDLQAQATVSPFNVDEIISVAEYFTSRDIWFSFDILHTSKGTAIDLTSKVPPENKIIGDHVPLGYDHLETLVYMLDGLINLKNTGRKIYQSRQYMEMLKDPRHSLDRSWLCAGHGYPGFLTIDADGSMMVCDDLSDPNISQYFVDTLPDHWEEFVKDWLIAARMCRGCVWSTHINSYDHTPANVQHKEIQK